MKKYIVIIALFALGITSTHAQSTVDTHTLTMTITDLSSTDGKVGVRLLNTEEKTVKQQWFSLETTTLEAVFIDVPTGTYAIQFFHDENNNDEMDFAWYGAPKEGYGNSNNVQGFFGPPEFVKQLFELSSDKSIHMKTID